MSDKPEPKVVVKLTARQARFLHVMMCSTLETCETQSILQDARNVIRKIEKAQATAGLTIGFGGPGGVQIPDQGKV